MLTIAIFLLHQTNTKAQERLQAVFKPNSDSILYDKDAISKMKSDSPISCSQQCARDKRCKSANFLPGEKTCSLVEKTKNTHPGLFLKQVNAIHLEKVQYKLSEN